MAKGLTLQELQSMGAKPVQKTGGLTLQQLQEMQKPKSLSDSIWGSLTSYGSRLKEDYLQGGQNIISGIEKGAEQVAGGILDIQAGKPFQGGADILGGFGRSALRTVGQVAQTAFTPITEAVSPIVEPAISAAVQSSPKLQEIIQRASELASKYPEAAKDVQNIVDIATLGLGGVAERPVIAGAEQATKEAINLSEKAAGKTSDIITKIKSKTTGLFKTKTAEEILATPEAELYKLAPAERNYYFENAKTKISEKAKALESQVQKDLQEKSIKIQTEAENLNRELSVASRDKVIELRPKIRTALGEQSQEYRRLVAEELAPHAERTVSQSELGSFIDTKYSENPELGQAIKTKLGLSDEILIPATTKTGLPTIQRPSDITIGELYDKTQSLGKEIGTAVKKGTRVYTADEKLIDDSIHTITDFMKTQGVDLKNARSFWAKYAPIRNQLVSEAKPFLQAETQTKTFAETLKRVASGKDVNNENFIGEVEKLLDEPATKELKDILVKISSNEKQEIATKIEAELKKASISLEKESALKGLNEAEFKVAQQATSRNVIKKVIGTVLIAAGYGKAREILPFLP